MSDSDPASNRFAAGRELDALVAEKVMGWHEHAYGDTVPLAICRAALKAMEPKNA
jgi:hypothetical protein